MNKTDIKCECGRTITIIIAPFERQIIASSPPTFPKIFSQDKPVTVLHPDDDVSDNQSRAIYAIAKKHNIAVPEYSKWNKGQASDWIEKNGGNQ